MIKAHWLSFREVAPKPPALEKNQKTKNVQNCKKLAVQGGNWFMFSPLDLL